MIDVLGQPLAGCALALTGKVLNLPREQTIELVQRAGGFVHDAVMGSTTVLVAKDPKAAWKTPKLKTAVQRGIPVIGEVAFREVLEGRLTLSDAMDIARRGAAFRCCPKIDAQLDAMSAAQSDELSVGF